MAQNFWRLTDGEKVIDFGCGTGAVREYLPEDISYWGIDISEDYIRAARKRFSGRGTFFLGTVREFLERDDSHLNSADLILCNGLLHHLADDEAIEVLKLSKRLMKHGGRLACVEATFLARQSRLSRWIVGKDRGKHVRSEREWKDLIGRVFESYSTCILTSLIRVPYTHIIIEGSNSPSSDGNSFEQRREKVSAAV